MLENLQDILFGRADLVRRAMGKKKLDIMEKEREIFINGLVEDGEVKVPGCVRNGIDAKSANTKAADTAKIIKTRIIFLCFITNLRINRYLFI